MPGPVARACDAVLDAIVVLLGTWTVVYHVCLVARLPSNLALLIELVVLVVAAFVWRRVRRAAEPEPLAVVTAHDQAHDRARDHTEDQIAFRLTLVTVVAAGAAAVAMAASFPWALVWVSWLVAGAAGTMLAYRRLPEATVAEPEPASRPGPRRSEEVFALAVAVAAAAFATITLRANPDDLFYVNLSQWIAAHGSFPHRDTIFANLTYPMSNWPPLASYDAGIGAVAHLLHASAGEIVYVVVPPIASLLSVLALWRLLRAWRVPRIPLALGGAVVFLLFDGTSSYGSPGNLWVTRLWQGKVILLCFLVPVLLVHALRYAERPRRAAWLFVVGTASVALSTTAVFLVPVVAAAGAAPLLRRSPRKALLGFAAMAAYPLGCGVVTLAVGGRSADDFGVRKQYRFDPSWLGHEVFLHGLVAFLGVAAVLVGVLIIPHPKARLTSGVAVLVTGITFIPGLTHVTYDLVGLGPTLWRITWACTVAALVGTAVAWVAERMAGHWPRRWLAGAATAVAVALLGVLGSPIWASDTSTSFAAPFHWQRGADSRATTRWMLAHTSPGDRVLAPDGLSITVAVTTTEITTVAPRDYYMHYLRDDPSFHYDQRLELVEFANHDDYWVPQDIAPALKLLDVRVACVYADDPAGATLLREAGYQPGLRTTTYQCLTR